MENKKMGRVVEETLKRVIESVYKEKVDKITDVWGNPPSVMNFFLMGEEGSSPTYTGIFYSNGGRYAFQLLKEGETWEVRY